MKHSVEAITLKNGMKGLLVNVPGASVMSTRVQFRAGMRYAKNLDVAEIAHVVEHLSFGANSKFKSEQAYEAEFTKNGAYHNAWTSDYSVCYETECADFEWKRILDLKRLAICEPKFNEEELKSEKGNVRSELTGYQNEYSRLLWPKLQQSIGENVPSLTDRIKTLNNIELKDIREHYRRTHTSGNLRFVIAGEISRHRKRELVSMLEQWQLHEGERFEIPLDDLHASDAHLIRRKDASNITFGFSWVTPRHFDPSEVQAMGCLNHILTGTMNSKIFGEARKRGLIYSIDSGVNSGTSSTSWDFEGEVNVENSEPLFALIQKELVKILGGELEESDLEAAKLYMLGRFQMSAQTVSQIADFYAETFFKNDEIEDFNTIPTLVKNVTKEKIVNLAREFSASGIHSLVAVSSCEKSIINSLNNYLSF
ncbi:insulinase family protein [Candidatus Saccharibacteria bacterium]|nr:insulinase family protein [Candidatus Saccharibacteria bacterium]